MRDTLPIPLDEEVLRCSRCGFCRVSCPILEVQGSESWNARGRMMLAKALKEGKTSVSKELIDRIYSCTFCKACEVTCPPKVKVTEIIGNLRVELVKSKADTLEEQKKIVDTILRTGNIYGLSDQPSIFKEKTGQKETERVIFIGCVAGYKYPKYVENFMQILDLTDLSFKLLSREVCCGWALYFLGFRNAFEELAKQNLELFEKNDVKEIFTICPMCYVTFEELYPKFTGKKIKVKHSTQILAELIHRGKIELIRPINANAIWFDSCHLGRHSNIYEEPRKILKAIPGLKLLDFERSKEFSKCCGGSIRVPFVQIRNALTNSILHDATSLGAQYLFLSCPTCLYNLYDISPRYDIKVCDLTESVAYSMKLIDKIPQYA